MLKFVNMELGDPETLAAVLVSQVPSVGGHGRSKALRKAVFPKWFVLFFFFCYTAWLTRSQFPNQGLNSMLRKHGVLTTSKVA